MFNCFLYKSKLACFYARKPNANAFEEVWNSNTSRDLTWIALSKFYNDENDYGDYYVDTSDAFPDREMYLNWLESTDFDD